MQGTALEDLLEITRNSMRRGPVAAEGMMQSSPSNWSSSCERRHLLALLILKRAKLASNRNSRRRDSPW